MPFKDQLRRGGAFISRYGRRLRVGSAPRADSPLVDVFDRYTEHWANWFSLSALPPFRPDQFDKIQSCLAKRDLLIVVEAITALALQAISFSAVGNWIVCLAVGLVIYRLFDLTIVLLRLGVHGTIRHDVFLRELPPDRIRRLLLACVFNYIELIALFAIVYRFAAWIGAAAFSEPMGAWTEAIAFSASSITTGSLSKAVPTNGVAVLLATYETLMGLLVLAIVIGTLVGLTNSQGIAPKAPAPRLLTGLDRQECWVLPFLPFLACAGLAYGLIQILR